MLEHVAVLAEWHRRHHEQLATLDPNQRLLNDNKNMKRSIIKLTTMQKL
jgi:hypothetical protein